MITSILAVWMILMKPLREKKGEIPSCPTLENTGRPQMSLRIKWCMSHQYLCFSVACFTCLCKLVH